MNKESKTKQEKSTKGFFTVIGDEAIASFKNKKNIDTDGQSVGVFRDKETLIDTITSKPALKTAKMAIVAVRVPNDAIVNPNHKTFGIKAGKNIRIIKTQPLEEVIEETKLSVTA